MYTRNLWLSKDFTIKLWAITCQNHVLIGKFPNSQIQTVSSSFSSQSCQKEIPQFQIFEENPFEHLDLEQWGGRGEGPIIILTASLLFRPCLPVYRPVYSCVFPCITVYCPDRVSRCIGTENLRSHTKPVSSASSTALAFSWFGIGIVLGLVSNPFHIKMLSLFGFLHQFSRNQMFISCLEGSWCQCKRITNALCTRLKNR